MHAMGKLIHATEDTECLFCGFDAARATGNWWTHPASMDGPEEYEAQDDVVVYCPFCGWDDEYSNTKTMHDVGREVIERYAHWLLVNERWLQAAAIIHHCSLEFAPYEKFDAANEPKLLQSLSYRSVMRIRTLIKSFESADKYGR